MANVITDKNRIDELLNSRYIETIFPSKEKAGEILASGKQLVFYLGIDPTSPNLHMGHTIPLFLLKQFAKLGHKITLLIGDFTAMIGDPTGKESARKALTEDEVRQNMETYVNQVKKILNGVQFEVKHNSKWLGKMTFRELIKLASHVTVQQMIARDMFKKRMSFVFSCPNCGTEKLVPAKLNERGEYQSEKTGKNLVSSMVCDLCNYGKENEEFNWKLISNPKPIYLHEFLYPLMQGYDSVAMKVDGEIGGNDQIFNMLVGRTLEKEYLNKEKLVFATRLLVNAETGKKISKTEGGFVSINSNPDDIFFGIMHGVPDVMIKTLFELTTEVPQNWIEDRQKMIEKGGNPKSFKEELAFELVKSYHGERAAEKARENFKNVYYQEQQPEEMQEFSLKSIGWAPFLTGTATITAVIKRSGITKSMSEAKNLVDGGGVKVNGQIVKEWNFEVKEGDIIEAGKKKRFLKIVK